MNYVPLYIKTHNSLLSSLINENDLIDYAKKHSLTSLAITDNNMYGVLDFYHLCKKNDIKPIIGLELELEDQKIVLYCKNYSGYQNLIYLSTKMSENSLVITDDIINIVFTVVFSVIAIIIIL